MRSRERSIDIVETYSKNYYSDLKDGKTNRRERRALERKRKNGKKS